MDNAPLTIITGFGLIIMAGLAAPQITSGFAETLPLYASSIGAVVAGLGFSGLLGR